MISVHYLLENLGAVVATTGCLTVVFVGALLAVQKESKKRLAHDQLEAERSAKEAALQAARTSTVDRTQYPGGKITVYYGTQTGTSESFAKDLEREGKNEHGFLIKVVDLEELNDTPKLLVQDDDDATNVTNMTTKDNVSKSMLPYGPTDTGTDNGRPRAIFLTATYGEGEPTDNATSLVNVMKGMLDDNNTTNNKDTSTLLSGLDYCVFGLGNTEYDIYNAMGKFFDTSISSFGGQRIMALGLGDDSDDIEQDFDVWKELLWTTLKSKYVPHEITQAKAMNGSATNGTSVVKLPDCEYSIDYHPELSLQDSYQSDRNRKSVPLDTVSSSSKNYFTAEDCPVSAVKELLTDTTSTTDIVNSTVHVEIDTTHAGPSIANYMTADNLGVLPCNQDRVVVAVATALGYDLDAIFSIKGGSNSDGTTIRELNGLPFPSPLSVRELLTRYLDLTSAPRRSDLKLLSHYATQTIDRRALQHLSSKDGKQDYKMKIMESKIGLVELLQLCPSLQIPLEHLIGNVCRFHLPRYYTISSSPKVHPHSIHLTVAVTREQRPTNSKNKNSNNNNDGSSSIFEGVCSTHIATSQSTNTMLRVFVRPSTFRLPHDISTPIIMIGPGTGIAPMRALLQDRKHQQQAEQKSSNNTNTNTVNDTNYNVLYFGCKHEEKDFIYRDELLEYKHDGTLNELHVAFSRKDPTKKQYVQHLLRQNSKETYNLIDKHNAYVYVCGGVKMGHDVTETIKEIIVEQASTTMSPSDAAAYVTKLSTNGRYVQELWS